jgi:membrane-bound lytic murein transglycosylase D
VNCDSESTPSTLKAEGGRRKAEGSSATRGLRSPQSLVTLLMTALLAACVQIPTAPEAESPGAPALAVQAPAPAPAPAAQEPAQVPAAEPVVAVPAPPLPPADVWARIRGGFRLSNLDGPLVQQWEQWYSTRPDYVARMVERGSHFLYHVIEEIERRKMPAEIALLPMIESAYNPQAYSRAHAAGMWQFIPSTGKLYGLQQNFWYDGRRDVLAATGAALDYLEKLYGMFNDWNLALAAYNWGEGAVSRAMARNQAKGLPTDYESLSMPAETRNYLPKLQAVKNIIANPEQFGLKLVDVPNKPYFATVTLPRHIDVKLAATFAEITIEDFRFLNPAHNKPVIRADGSEIIVLPIDKLAAFKRNLAAYDDGPLATWQAYTVKRSDNPEKLAAKHGISLTRLKEVNGINGRRNIVAGQTILVPHKGTAEPNLPDLPAAKITRVRYQPKRSNCVQVVKAGKKQLRCSAPAKKTTVAKKSTASKKAVAKKAPAPTKRTDVAEVR